MTPSDTPALGLATCMLPGGLSEKTEIIKRAGFSGLSLNEADLLGFPGKAADIAADIKAKGLHLHAFETSLSLEDLLDGDEAALEPRLGQKLALCQALGSPVLVIKTGGTQAPNESKRRSDQVLPVLAKQAETHGVRIALEATPDTALFGSETEWLTALQKGDSPWVGLCLNAAHALRGGAQSARLRDIPGNRVFHAYLVDAPAGSLQETLLPGQGDLNLSGFVRVLVRAGYDGPWTLSQNTSTGVARSAAMAHDGYRSLVTLLDELAQREPSLAPPHPGLPPRVYPTGLEYVEFAVDEAAKTVLVDQLEALCFRLERQHVSKNVQLWRQGAVNIVVNTPSDGHAKDVLREHGPGVSEIGLRVANAAQTVARATALGAPSYSKPVGAGELDIPAIKGVGGSVVHFIDEQSDLHRVWDIEFDPVPTTAARQPCGLRRIDHLAQTMRLDEMQSWLTYYTSTFELEKTAITDVADPSGPVLSQALSSPAGEIRLNLNGAAEQRTFAGSFLEQGFGAGVQHIAFATDDIFETAARLAETGLKRLVISDNYYDDLQARFGLKPELVEQLREARILYDRKEGTEYFQLYCQPILGGFFFEIIERRGGYQGYGARNAPVRLAAQTRLSAGT